MNRGLDKASAFTVDGYLLHHILIKSRLDSAQETYASDGVTTADRVFRHKNLCANTCENCAERDTCEHRLYSCVATKPVRERVVWNEQDQNRVDLQGLACRKFGIWAIPLDARLCCSEGILNLLEAEVVREFFDHVRTLTRSSRLSIVLAVRTFACPHPL
eukprot:3168815-Amphidinium_carterae.1